MEKETIKEQFKDQLTDVSFGTAINALKIGYRITRKGWNGKDLFVFMQIPSTISLDIIPKMQSLPQSVKDVFIERGSCIGYSNQMALVDKFNNISGWTPSGSDALAEDWEILI